MWTFLAVSLSVTGVADGQLASNSSPASHLTIRLFSQRRMTHAQVVSSSGAWCDGKPVSEKRLALRSQGAWVKLASRKRCRDLQVHGPFHVLTGEAKRHYRGSLKVTSAEGRLQFDNQVSVEDYLLGVLALEARAGADQAMRAQAVVSRTYALAMKERKVHTGFDLCDTPHCQVYRGVSAERRDVELAVAATTGEVLRTHEGHVGDTWFHASCGGATSRPQDVFGGRNPAPGVTDMEEGHALCSSVAKNHWTWRVKKKDLARALGVLELPPTLFVTRKDLAGRVLKLEAFDVAFRADTFLAKVGRKFGYTKLKSAFFTVKSTKDEFVFTGRGEGHGVGMCQQGAWARAKRGDDYQAILRHYFPSQTLGKY